MIMAKSIPTTSETSKTITLCKIVKIQIQAIFMIGIIQKMIIKLVLIALMIIKDN
jgi:hypothetical protein